MDKLKRYLGLAAAVLLLVPIFIKLDIGRSVGSVERFYSTLPPFGFTVPTAVAFAIHPARRLWGPATECLEMMDRSPRSVRSPPSCSWDAYTSVREFVADHQPEFDVYQPGLAELLGSYRATKESRERLLWERTQAAKLWEEKSNLPNEERFHLAMKQAGAEVGWMEASAAKKRAEMDQRWAKAELAWTEAQRAADLLLGAHAPSKEQRANDLVMARLPNGPSVFAEAYNSRLLELESRIVPALKGYLVAARPTLAGLIVAVHLLLLLSVVLMIWKRDRVGAAILWPFTALVGAGKEGAQAAKRIHEKV